VTNISWEATKDERGRVCVRVKGCPHPLYVDGSGLSDKDLTRRIVGVVETHFAQEQLKKTKAALTRVEGLLRSQTEAESPITSPPAIAEALISMFSAKRFSESQLGDMQEIFDNNVKRFGPKRAKRLYWYEVVRSVGPILFHWLKRIGFVAILVDYGRKKMGL
jgi:hypothetical protein